MPSGQTSDGGHAIFEPYVRADQTTGMLIENPHGEEPWVVHVTVVGEADADGMVVLHDATYGPIRPVSRDWPCQQVTEDYAAARRGEHERRERRAGICDEEGLS